MSGKVKRRLTQSSAFTAVPAAPSSMVITTDFTPGPKPKAPTVPNRQLTIMEMKNALDTAGTNFLGWGMASWTEKRVKWMKKRNATVPKKPEKAAGLDVGMAAICSGFDSATTITQVIPSATEMVPMREMKFTPLNERSLEVRGGEDARRAPG